MKLSEFKTKLRFLRTTMSLISLKDEDQTYHVPEWLTKPRKVFAFDDEGIFLTTRLPEEKRMVGDSGFRITVLEMIDDDNFRDLGDNLFEFIDDGTVSVYKVEF